MKSINSNSQTIQNERKKNKINRNPRRCSNKKVKKKSSIDIKYKNIQNMLVMRMMGENTPTIGKKKIEKKERKLEEEREGGGKKRKVLAVAIVVEVVPVDGFEDDGDKFERDDEVEKAIESL